MAAQMNATISDVLDVRKVEYLFKQIDKKKKKRISRKQLKEEIEESTECEHFDDCIITSLFVRFSRKKFGYLDFSEFLNCYRFLGNWMYIFNKYKVRGTNRIDKDGVLNALALFNYQLEPVTVERYVAKYGSSESLRLDQFINVMLSIQESTKIFEVNAAADERGIIKRLTFDNYLRNCLRLVPDSSNNNER